MTQEEKARAYDEAIKRAKEINNEQKAQPFDVMLKVFPELKESEDEKIKKVLIELVKCNERSGYKLLNNVSTSSMLDWLEKQGEQDTDISSFPEEQQVFMRKYVSLDKITLIKLLAERDANNAEIIESFEKQSNQKPYGQRAECLDCQFNYAGECKGSCAMKRIEQKPAWSEEDEYRLKSCLSILEPKTLTGTIKTINSKWLRSLKERIK